MTDRREQSIRFLRGLNTGDAGVTIYQDIIDDVLSALDSAIAAAEAARAQERKAIIVWLRNRGATRYHDDIDFAADCIERGEHRQQP